MKAVRGDVSILYLPNYEQVLVEKKRVRGCSLLDW